MKHVICPRCGGTVQIEDGRSAMCPYCALELSASSADSGTAFAQAVQYAEPPAGGQNAQNIPRQKPPAVPPALRKMRDQAAFGKKTKKDEGIFEQNAQYKKQLTADASDAAYRNRKIGNWYILNLLLLLLQAVTAGVMASRDFYFDGIAEMLKAFFLGSLLLFPCISALTRPNECYVDDKPFPKNRGLLILLMAVLGWVAALAGAAVEMWLEWLFL